MPRDEAAPGPSPSRRSVAAAVSHSSRCRRETNRRYERPHDRVDAASRAWSARNDDRRSRPGRPSRRGRPAQRAAAPRASRPRTQPTSVPRIACSRRQRRHGQRRRASRARASRAGPSSPGRAARPAPAAPGCGAGCRRSSSAPGPAAGSAAGPSAVGTRAAEPGQQLPVAADPAVLAAGVGVVAGREVVEQLDVGDQAAAGVVPLDQVVAEDVVLGEGRARWPPRRRRRRRSPCR